jgi:hypothetical protein
MLFIVSSDSRLLDLHQSPTVVFSITFFQYVKELFDIYTFVYHQVWRITDSNR